MINYQVSGWSARLEIHGVFVSVSRSTNWQAVCLSCHSSLTLVLSQDWLELLKFLPCHAPVQAAVRPDPSYRGLQIQFLPSSNPMPPSGLITVPGFQGSCRLRPWVSYLLLDSEFFFLSNKPSVPRQCGLASSLPGRHFFLHWTPYRRQVPTFYVQLFVLVFYQ